MAHAAHPCLLPHLPDHQLPVLTAPAPAPPPRPLLTSPLPPRPPISRAGLPDVPRLNLPQQQNGTWHLPMNATVLQSHGSSDAGLSSSRTASTAHTSSLAGMRVASLQVMPLTTSRLSSCGGGSGGEGHSARSAPGNSRVPEGPSSSTAGLGMEAHFSSSSGRTFGGPGSSARGGGSGPTGALHWSHRLTHGTQGHSVSPAAAGHVHSDPYGCPRTPSAAGGLPSTHSDLAHMHADLAHVSPYLAHRARASMYLDQELHVLCMQLALHLLVTPSGQLDPVQLPAEPSGALVTFRQHVDSTVCCMVLCTSPCPAPADDASGQLDLLQLPAEPSGRW
jgi:hypothetical protein